VNRWQEEAKEYAKTLLTSLALALFIITFIAQSFRVDGVSMMPTLHHGDRLMIDKLSYRFREPQRGEIVVFRYPANPRHRFIKRIIGLPGDIIEGRNHTLYLNGQPLAEDYTNDRTYGDFGPIVVPDGRYFVMGDNRNNSEDSRYPDVGPVPRHLLVGRAMFQYWPLTRIRGMRIPELFRHNAAIESGTATSTAPNTQSRQ
jgi:signal peptidase I